MLAGAAIVVGLIAVAIVLAVVFTRSSSKKTTVPVVGSIAQGLPEAAVVDALFKGIPQRGLTLGASSAPVTLVEYIDLQCPFCRAFETETFPDLVRRFIRRRKLRVVVRPWAFIGPDSLRGQAAVIAAGEQDRAFNFAELLYDNQGTENTGWLNNRMVTAVASSIPKLFVRDLLTAQNSPAVEAQVQLVDREARADNVNGTPTLFIGKSGTHGAIVRLKSPTDEQAVVRAISAALRS